MATTDRHGNENGAVQFNIGYYQFPSGIYFYNEFTFMIWIKTLSYNNWQRVFDFGEGFKINNLFIGMKVSTGVAELHANEFAQLTNNVVFPLNEWVHVAVTSQDDTTFFINGVKIFSLGGRVKKSSETNYNYIGKSQINADSNAHAVFDDFKIFNRAFTQQEILKEKEEIYYELILKQLN